MIFTPFHLHLSLFCRDSLCFAVCLKDPDVFAEMERAAVRLGKLVGYVSAGTIEYLYTTDNDFTFLELNPRLQVCSPTILFYFFTQKLIEEERPNAPVWSV